MDVTAKNRVLLACSGLEARDAVNILQGTGQSPTTKNLPTQKKSTVPEISL